MGDQYTGDENAEVWDRGVMDDYLEQNRIILIQLAEINSFILRIFAVINSYIYRKEII